MTLFTHKNGSLAVINALTSLKEKDLQQLVEHNLNELLDMHFLASEFRTSTGGRIDTLAVDNNGAPVIIEYKRYKDDRVINQSLSYLKWLMTQKRDFFRELMVKKLGEKLANEIGLDWRHPRVICIAESYGPSDIDTVEMLKIRIDLYKYRHYDDGLFSLEAVNVHGSSESPRQISHILDSDSSYAVVEAMKTQGEALPVICSLFDDLREQILELDEDIVEKPGRRAVAYRINKNFAEIMIRSDKLVINLRSIEYDDPQGIVEEFAQSYAFTLNRRIQISSRRDLDYAMSIITQSYKNVL